MTVLFALKNMSYKDSAKFSFKNIKEKLKHQKEKDK